MRRGAARSEWPAQPDWLRRATESMEEGYKWTVEMEMEAWAIIKSPGGGYSSGGHHSYDPVRYHLIDKRRAGSWTAMSQVHRGRLTNARRAELLQLLENLVKGEEAKHERDQNNEHHAAPD